MKKQSNLGRLLSYAGNRKILSYLSPDWILDVVMQQGRKDSLKNGVIDTIVVKNVFGGTSRLSFKSADQGREKFQGASLDFVWFDEEPPKDIYEECVMRVLDRCGEIYCTMTPLKGLTWVYDEIYLNVRQNPEIWYEQMEWKDNPYLDENEVEKLIASTSDDLQESRRFGRFKSEGGLVYSEFDETVLNINHHVKKIFELADSLGWARDGKGRLSALIDSASEQRTLAYQKSVAELFYDNGILVNSKVDKNLFSGISRIKSLFFERPPRIYIFRNCVNMIREIKGYNWGDGDRPVKRDDHAMDDLRYFVMSRPEPQDALFKTDKGLIGEDKDNLIRKLKRGRYEKR